MKTDRYQPRFYRQWGHSEKLYTAHICVRQTDLQVLTDKPLEESFLVARIGLYRRQIEDYIDKDRRFLITLKPLAVELRAPLIVRKMSQAAHRANVGPMATVAGAIAQFLGRALLRRGYRDVIIENGGDVFLKVSKAINVGIFAGGSKMTKNLSLRIRPQDSPLGICTSSGTVGHSLSFGCADAAIIFSSDAILADAVATATANRINSKEDLQKTLDFARSIKGITAAVIILKNNLAAWGKVEFA